MADSRRTIALILGGLAVAGVFAFVALLLTRDDGIGLPEDRIAATQILGRKRHELSEVLGPAEYDKMFGTTYYDLAPWKLHVHFSRESRAAVGWEIVFWNFDLARTRGVRTPTADAVATWFSIPADRTVNGRPVAVVPCYGGFENCYAVYDRAYLDMLDAEVERLVTEHAATLDKLEGRDRDIQLRSYRRRAQDEYDLVDLDDAE